MIVYREWKSGGIPGFEKYIKQGWFLFGIFPLYIKRVPIRYVFRI